MIFYPPGCTHPGGIFCPKTSQCRWSGYSGWSTTRVRNDIGCGASPLGRGASPLGRRACPPRPTVNWTKNGGFWEMYS